MKNKFFIILSILLILTAVSGYFVYQYRSNAINAQKINNEYASYYNKQMLGNELMSIINKTIDINNKSNIERDQKNYFIDNENNSIKIYIVFNYKDETKTMQMEDIEKGTSEAFIKTYSTASFKCTKIEYHEKTKNVKSLLFEEITNKN